MPLLPEIKGILSNEVRHAQMAEALKSGYPFMKKATGFHDLKLTIACYGPSLKQTWQEIKNTRQHLMTVSGAHDFLQERGCRIGWHVEIDPRPNKVAMLKPRLFTKYLMATVCHPDIWDVLGGQDVELWHLINDEATVEWVKQNDPEHIDSMIGGNSTAGQRALNVAAALGFRKFDIYGMDCSFTEEQHAGRHTGKPELQLPVWIAGRKFTTTPQMFQAAREMEQFLRTYDADVTFHGNGLMQEIAKHIQQRKVNA